MKILGSPHVAGFYGAGPKTERALSILFSSVWWFLVYEIFMQKET